MSINADIALLSISRFIMPGQTPHVILYISQYPATCDDCLLLVLTQTLVPPPREVKDPIRCRPDLTRPFLDIPLCLKHSLPSHLTATSCT